MSDENFLSRWSRRKRARTDASPPPPETRGRVGKGGDPGAELRPTSSDGTDPRRASPLPGEGSAEVTPDHLPPLESLNAASDYTAFLKPDVPAAVRSAALRRAWVADPAIADFRGMADYDWDFNAPGYGKFLAVDDVAKLAEAVFGPAPAETAGEPEPARAEQTATPLPGEESAHSAFPDTVRRSGTEPPDTPGPNLAGEGGGQGLVAAAAEEPLEAGPGEPSPPQRRRHGGAMPA